MGDIHDGNINFYFRIGNLKLGVTAARDSAPGLTTSLRGRLHITLSSRGEGGFQMFTFNYEGEGGFS